MMGFLRFEKCRFEASQARDVPGMNTRPRSPVGDPMTLGNMRATACGRSTCHAGSAKVTADHPPPVGAPVRRHRLALDWACHRQPQEPFGETDQVGRQHQQRPVGRSKSAGRLVESAEARIHPILRQGRQRVARDVSHSESRIRRGKRDRIAQRGRLTRQSVCAVNCTDPTFGSSAPISPPQLVSCSVGGVT
jgi:hypothetical protein